ncbi:MAG: hypothetical protein KAR21_12735, partial [Spirochaetales bacterium]|nr:hypothetical protein [Spirochaetales bacterium]
MKIIILTFLVIILFTSNIIAEESTITLKYHFWSIPSYTFDGENYNNYCSSFSLGTPGKEFTQHFQKDLEEYELIRKASKKYIFGSLLGGLPGSFLLGLCTTDQISSHQIFPGNTSAYAWAGAVLLCIIDIGLGVSAYNDLKDAAQLRNERFNKQ